MSADLDNIPPDRDEQAAIWCLALADGELPSEERAAFERWMTDHENARAFDEAALVWNVAENAAESPELIQMRAAALEHFRRANQQRWTRGISRKWYWAGAIAAIFLLAVLSVALFYHPTEVYETGIGERRIAMLGDGSKLSLDADTEVDVRLTRDRRELTLVRGRARFDVAHDPLRPFAVSAGDKIVVATGTSFSVEMLNQRVHVLLFEGHVSVLNKRDDKPVLQQPVARARALAADQALIPGRELVAMIDVAEPATIVSVDPVRAASWEAGQLSFDDEPLQTAVQRVNRYAKAKLVIADGPTARVRVTGVFTAGDTDAFIEGVSALNDVRVTQESGQLTLKRN